MREHYRISLGNVPKVDNGCHEIKGDKVFVKDGLKHRVNGPAVIKRDGALEYYQEGVKHRDGGLPAVIFPDGKIEYWEKGVFIKRCEVDPDRLKTLR